MRALERLRAEAAECQACPLWKPATQTVFGEGDSPASVMLVGEQPGDVEDRAGRPFVGPAGRLLRELVDDAGLDSDELYVTNAVKHLKWRPSGKRRIHDTPNWSEIRACNHWLRLELQAVRPDVVVCLGATAAQALLGSSARVGALRGRVHEIEGIGQVVVTIHPSAILRSRDDRAAMRARLVQDLVRARDAVPVGAPS
jgi:uracil-DNA glycosylase